MLVPMSGTNRTLHTTNVGRHFPIGDARPIKQGGLNVLVIKGVSFSLACAGRQGDVGAAGVGIDDEDIGAGHTRALAQADPLLGGWTLDLKVDVAFAARCGYLGHIDAVANVVARAVSGGLRIGSGSYREQAKFSSLAAFGR